MGQLTVKVNLMWSVKKEKKMKRLVSFTIRKGKKGAQTMFLHVICQYFAFIVSKMYVQLLIALVEEEGKGIHLAF